MTIRISQKNPNSKLHYFFSSPWETLRYIREQNITPKRQKSSNKDKDYGFNYFTDLAEAIDVFTNRPHEVALFDPNQDKLLTQSSIGNQVEYDVEGDWIDVDRFIEGVPEVFGNAVMGNPRNVFVTINILCARVSYTEESYIRAIGRRVLRLSDWLESNNIRTQIVVSDSSVISSITTVVKQFHDPFDVNSMSITLNPDWLRRIEFLLMEQSPTWQSGYGNAVRYDQDMFEENRKQRDWPNFSVYFGGYRPLPEEALDKQADYIEKRIYKMMEEDYWFLEPGEEPLATGVSGR